MMKRTMFIHAKSDRTTDQYYIEGVNNLKELKEIINNSSAPIRCKQTNGGVWYNVIKEELMVDKLVYFNNYLRLSETFDYLMNKEERNKIQKKYCDYCRFNRDDIQSALSCSYESNDDGGCNNFEKYITFKEALKTLFSKPKNP